MLYSYRLHSCVFCGKDIKNSAETNKYCHAYLLFYDCQDVGTLSLQAVTTLNKCA